MYIQISNKNAFHNILFLLVGLTKKENSKPIYKHQSNKDSVWVIAKNQCVWFSGDDVDALN